MTESSNKKKKYMGLSVLALISIGACSMYTFNQSQTKTEVAQETSENTTESVSVTQKETTKTPQTTVATSKEPSNELDKIVELAQAEVGEVVETSLLNNVVALSENVTGSNEVLDKVIEIVTPEKPEDNLAVISVVKPDETTKQITEQLSTPTTSEKTSEESPVSSETPTPEQPSLPEEPNVPLPEPEQPTEPELTDQEKTLDIKTKEIDGQEVKYATGDALTQEELPEFDASQLSHTTETN